MAQDKTELIEISIPYYYNPETRLLHSSPDGGKPVRTQFFSDKQLKSLHTQTNIIDDLNKKE